MNGLDFPSFQFSHAIPYSKIFFISQSILLHILQLSTE